MLSLGNPTQVQFKTLCQNLQLHPKSQFLFSTYLNFLASPCNLRSGLRSNALKPKKTKNFSPPVAEAPDDFDEFFDLDDDADLEEEDEEEDEEEGDIDVPLKNMKRWIQNRPRGFGEGKMYDTSVEDKLMEEIEKGRIAQLANVNKLKHNPINPGANKPIKASPEVQEGFQVRLVNLPKKKNIHKDLRLAFQGVPGLLNIFPVNDGNEKTRDPVCKGLAFMYFKYEDEAQRFVQNFSGQMISFGKLEKKLTCEVVDSSSSKPSNDPSVNAVQSTRKQSVNAVQSTGKQSVTAVQSTRKQSVTAVQSTRKQPARRIDKPLDISLIDIQDISPSKEHHDAEEKHFSAQSVDDSVNLEISSTSRANTSKELETRAKSRDNSSPSKKEERKAKPKKKKVPVSASGKVHALQKLGSANRLKVRDKAMLTDVFSKYGSKANATSAVEQVSR